MAARGRTRVHARTGRLTPTGPLARRATAISSVTPVTPRRPATWSKAMWLWDWTSTSPVSVTQPLRTRTSRSSPGIDADEALKRGAADLRLLTAILVENARVQLVDNGDARIPRASLTAARSSAKLPTVPRSVCSSP
jgi:hypothetical protein